MTLQVRCTTRFDITVTEVRNNFSRSRLPFYDATGKLIDDTITWNRARNQQRNWETINQVISLRSLPENITVSRKINKADQAWWTFEFSLEQPASIESNGNPVGLLDLDCNSVPMLTGLDEDPDQEGVLIPDINIQFETITHK